MIHVNIRVEGYVQGVGFRFVARNEARLRGLKGFVMNECDGSVYIEAEGPAEKVDDFISWCHKGPSAAHITNVSFKKSEVKGLKGFDIRY